MFYFRCFGWKTIWRSMLIGRRISSSPMKATFLWTKQNCPTWAIIPVGHWTWSHEGSASLPPSLSMVSGYFLFLKPNLACHVNLDFIMPTVLYSLEMSRAIKTTALNVKSDDKVVSMTAILFQFRRGVVRLHGCHYNDAIMGTIASQIASLTIVYSTDYSDADQRKHQSSASLAFVRGIHRGPVNSLHKWPVTRKMFPFDDVIMFTINQSHESHTSPVPYPTIHHFWDKNVHISVPK